MNRYMKIAVEEAEHGIELGHGGPFGAVIVKDGKVVGKGHNCVVKNNDPTCHGEIEAIRDACKNLATFDLSGAEIYTTGEPCPMCLCAILWANISKIHFGCTISENEMIGFRDKVLHEKLNLSTKEIPIEQVDHEECLKLFERYNKIENKKMY